nr:MAG TPA: hypothetical protein [Siphoviridae sp. ctFjF5]DAU57459.1 MAG TPA: hypothetical protein [Caudoviricetes sp.]
MSYFNYKEISAFKRVLNGKEKEMELQKFT